MAHDGIPHRSVTLVVGHVVPRTGLSGLCGVGRQRAADRKDVRGSRDVRCRYRCRNSVGNGQPSSLSPATARTDSASCGSTPRNVAGREATLGGQLIEVGGRTETLCGVAVIFGPLPAEQVHGRPDALGQHGSLAGPVVVNEDHHGCDPSHLIRSQPTSAFQVLLLKLGVALLTIGMMRLRAIVSRPG